MDLKSMGEERSYVYMLISFRLTETHLPRYVKTVTSMTGYNKDGDYVNLAICIFNFGVKEICLTGPNHPFQNHYQYSVVTVTQYNTPTSRHSRPSSFKTDAANTNLSF